MSTRLAGRRRTGAELSEPTAAITTVYHEASKVHEGLEAF